MFRGFLCGIFLNSSKEKLKPYSNDYAAYCYVHIILFCRVRSQRHPKQMKGLFVPKQKRQTNESKCSIIAGGGKWGSTATQNPFKIIIKTPLCHFFWHVSKNNGIFRWEEKSGKAFWLLSWSNPAGPRITSIAVIYCFVSQKDSSVGRGKQFLFPFDSIVQFFSVPISTFCTPWNATLRISEMISWIWCAPLNIKPICLSKKSNWNHFQCFRRYCFW